MEFHFTSSFKIVNVFNPTQERNCLCIEKLIIYWLERYTNPCKWKNVSSFHLQIHFNIHLELKCVTYSNIERHLTPSNGRVFRTLFINLNSLLHQMDKFQSISSLRNWKCIYPDKKLLPLMERLIISQFERQFIPTKWCGNIAFSFLLQSWVCI